MSFANALRCRECNREYPLDPIYVCDFCFGPLEVAYDYDAMRDAISREKIEAGPLSVWRYADLLPCDLAFVVDIQAGFTPLLKAQRLGDELGLRNLYIKNDCANPTWSFKDRVVTVAATKAREFGFEILACASTGNLANSVSAHAARAGLDSFVFIPSDLEQGKIVGSSIYDATLVAIDGNYDDVNRLCSELAGKYPWAFVNVNMRPYYAEGSKTLGYEIAEQLGWQAPDQVIAPMASGSLYVKIWKGFQELEKLLLIEDVHTTMHGIQAEGCSPITKAWEDGTTAVRPVRPKTIAKSLAIGNPADAYYALGVMKETGGSSLAVSDDEIVAGIKLLAQTEGVFAETAGGVTIAGLKRLAEAGKIGADEVTVAVITGAGLKTQEAVIDTLAPPPIIEPTMASFEKAMGERDEVSLQAANSAP